MSTDFYSKEIQFTYQGKNYTIENFAPSNATVSCNLKALFDRKKGTHFIVDGEGEELRETLGWRDWIAFQYDAKGERAKVKGVIDAALAEFNAFLTNYHDQKTAQIAVKCLFDKASDTGIGRLGKTLYNHKLLKCDNCFSKYFFPENTIRLKISDHQFVDITSKKFEGKEIPFLLDLDLGNEKTNHNLWMLLKRKKGQIYEVNAEQKLEKVKTFWSYRKNKTEIEEQVQAVVKEVLGALNGHLAKTTMTVTHQMVIERIFSSNIFLCKTMKKRTAEDSPLCRMGRKTFDRSAIAEGSHLEKILNPELQKKRDALAKALKELRDIPVDKDKNAAKRHVERAFMDLVFEEFEFAQKLGIDLERNHDGGSGGARYACNRYGEKILVIKPGDEGPLEVNNPQWYARLKRLILSPKACLEGNPEQMNELDSWLWDRHFDIWSVPPTEIRYVASSNFIGNRYKECSIQMFVEDCETLGKYVGISKRIHWFPRRFLRWYCGSRYGTGLFYSIGQREQKKEEIMAKLPLHSIERVAIHNMGIEDIDCHPENILVKVADVSSEETLLDRIFDGDLNAEDAEIDALVSNLFQSKGNQNLLQQLLFSEKVTVDGETKRVTVIKHDGGASHPKSHPNWWDYLSLRYKHLFEVLPHFEEMFTSEGRGLIEGKENVFAKFLLEKGTRNLRGILTPEVFQTFWSSRTNRMLLKRWILETDSDTEVALRLDVISALFKASKLKAEDDIDDFLFYFKYHLKRIRGNLQTRIDSFRVLNKYVQSDEHTMRYMFNKVKSGDDFKRELEDLNDGFENIMREWKRKMCVKRSFHEGSFLKSSLRQAFFLKDLESNDEF